jgi:hypothetical protein
MSSISTTAAPRSDFRSLLGSIDFRAIAVWLLGFGLVLYLAFNGGGFGPIVRDQLGVIVWWGVLLGLAVGILPLTRLRRGSWVSLGLLTAYVCWAALSLIWTDVSHNTIEDVGKFVTYLGVFALALAIRDEKGGRRMIAALASAITIVAVVALASRLHPAWVPAARESVEIAGKQASRLSYPLGYWNGDASLIAIALPLLLHLASSARYLVVRALAAAVLPLLGLTIYLTFSRGGTLAAVFGVIVFLALAHDRLPKAVTVLSAAIGTAILGFATHERTALAEGLGSGAAHHQGNEVLVMALIVAAGVGLIQVGMMLALRRGRPAWTKPSRRLSLATVGTVVAIIFIAVVALAASGKFSHAFHEFKAGKGPGHGASRLGSVSGNGRWPVWSAAVHENASAPLIGGGSGSFESWWAQHKTEPEFVQDAHSLYLEALAELGIIGFALIVGFLLSVLVLGARMYRKASIRRKTQVAAALAGCAAFCLGAAYDWLWQLAVVPIAFLLLASVLVSAGDRRRSRPFPLPARLGGIAFAVAAMVAISIPLSAAVALEQSQSEYRAGNLEAALEEAASARRVAPYTAQPWTQEALILEAQGHNTAALHAAQEATRAEPKEWRAWVVRSRLEAAAGHPEASLDAYREARSLNPLSHLFQQKSKGE